MQDGVSRVDAILDGLVHRVKGKKQQETRGQAAMLADWLTRRS